MPGTFASSRIFAHDLDPRGNPVRAWETIAGGSEADAIAEAKAASERHAGALVVRREANPAVGATSTSGSIGCGRRPGLG